MATKTLRRKLYTLEDPVWMTKAGLTKGIHHDRQHLGIILGAGSTFKIRQIEGVGSVQLNLRLLNNDSKLEKSLPFSKEGISVRVEHASVPFVDTPYTTQQAVSVEYEYDTGSKILPVYKKYDPEDQFFSKWDGQKAELALIESDYVLCLVPECDKEAVRKPTQGNINNLIDYFDRVLTFYNELAGLSFEPHQESDRNIRNRYFLKADAHGSGGAYYGGSCSAANSTSIKGWWLTGEDSNWGNLHEIAHGYQGGFMRTPGFAAGEVWNNVYAASFQNIHLGDKIWTDGWLYDYGNYESVFETLKTNLKDNVPLNKWNLRCKLNFLMLLKDKGGDQGFTYFNQAYRRHANAPDYNSERFTLLDMLSAAYSRISKIDLTAFIQRVGGILSDEQIEKNRLFHEKVAYPLCELVKPEELAGVLTTLNLKNPLTLVDPSALKRTGLKGDLNVTLNIDQFPEIYGETFTLMEGQRYALHAKITQRNLSLPGIPIGVYTMILPTGKGVKYSIDKYYAVVKTGTNVLEIKYSLIQTSALFNQNFNLLGLGNSKFASIQVNYLERNVNISVISENPHSYFPGKKYAQITLKASDGTVVFDMEIQGTNATLSTDKIPFQEGYQLVIYHAEPSRLNTVVAGESAKLLTGDKDKTNIFTISSTGVYNNGIPGSSFSIQYTKDRVEAAAAEARKNPRILRSKYDKRKDEIYLVLMKYPEPERSVLMTQYKDVLPSENTSPGFGVGNAFLFTFLGYANKEFMRAKVDFIKNLLVVTTKAVKPHGCFIGSKYASLRCVDSNGMERFVKEFVGDQTVVEETVTIPICYFGGEKLYVYHAESEDRLVLTNEMQDKRVQAQRNNIYSFTQNGIEVLHGSAVESHDPPALYLLE